MDDDLTRLRKFNDLTGRAAVEGHAVWSTLDGNFSDLSKPHKAVKALHWLRGDGLAQFGKENNRPYKKNQIVFEYDDGSISVADITDMTERAGCLDEVAQTALFDAVSSFVFERDLGRQPFHVAPVPLAKRGLN